MTDDLIIQQLKDKEAQPLEELNRVQLALNAFIERNISFGNTTYQEEIQMLGPEFEQAKLHKRISHNLSMLAKYSKVKKTPLNRKIKYSL